MMLSNDLYDSILNFELELICSKMRLLKPGYKRRYLATGYGIIKHNRDKTIHFKMFVTHLNENISDIFKLPNLSKGLHYHDFSATDSNGNECSIKVFSYSLSKRLDGKSNPFLSGPIEYIEILNDPPQVQMPNYVELCFRNGYEFPYNYNFKIEEKSDDGVNKSRYVSKVKFKSKDLVVNSDKFESSQIFRFFTDNQNAKYDTRILEGLIFITGQNLNPIYSERKNNNQVKTKIFGDSKLISEQHFPAPLKVEKYPSEQALDSWKIFKLYLDYISDNDYEFYTPLGSEINSLLGASTAHFETKIVILCIKIEAIIKLLFKDNSKPSKEFCEKIDNLIEFISHWEVDESIITRAKNLLNTMHNPRVRDVIDSLKNLGVINDSQIRSWTYLRNKYVHGVRNEGNRWFRSTQKKSLDILEMYYRIILHKLKYKGLYTSYGSDNWPDIKYKLYDCRPDTF